MRLLALDAAVLARGLAAGSTVCASVHLTWALLRGVAVCFCRSSACKTAVGVAQCSGLSARIRLGNSGTEAWTVGTGVVIMTRTVPLPRSRAWTHPLLGVARFEQPGGHATLGFCFSALIRHACGASAQNIRIALPICLSGNVRRRVAQKTRWECATACCPFARSHTRCQVRIC